MFINLLSIVLYCFSKLDCDTVIEFLCFLILFTHVQQQLTVICKADTFSFCLEEKQMREIGSVFPLTGVELLPKPLSSKWKLAITNNYNFRVLLSCLFIVENNIISQSLSLTWAFLIKPIAMSIFV